MKTKQESDIEALEESRLMRDFEDGTELREEAWHRREAPETTSTISYIRPPRNQTHWVVTSQGLVFEYGAEDIVTNRNKAGGMAVIWSRSGGFQIPEDESLIPICVAKMGNPSMATYLYSVFDMSLEEISDILEIGPGTAEQYVSKVRRGNR